MEVIVMIMVIVAYAGSNFYYMRKLGGYMKEISQKFDALAELHDSPEASQLLKDYPSFLLGVSMLSQSFINFPRATALAKGFLDKINEVLTSHEEHLKQI
jgi:hypothetical protein